MEKEEGGERNWRKEGRAKRGEEEGAGREGRRKGRGEEGKERIRNERRDGGRWVNLGSGIKYLTYLNHIESETRTFTFAKLFV